MSPQFFGYDDDGLPTCASSTSCLPVNADALRITYDSNRLLAARNMGTVIETLTSTEFGELASQVASVGGSTVFSESYHTPTAPRDGLGRITRKTETIEGGTQVFDYTYDQNGRLQTVTQGGTQTTTYDYDPNGNRTLVATSAGSVAATYDIQDQLLTFGELTFTYGPRGERLSKIDGVTGDVTSYEYDAFGNLKRVSLPNGDVVEYLVDGVHRRVGKRLNGILVRQWLYRATPNPVAELDGAGALAARFVYASRTDVPDYVIRDGTTYRILTDHLGSTRLIVNVGTGQIVRRMRHDAFGVVLEDTNPGFVPFGFAGGMGDSDTGLVRFGARDYDPSVGRWTSRDPILFNGETTNLHQYAGNDPVNVVDRSGLIGDSLGWSVEGGGLVFPVLAALFGGYTLPVGIELSAGVFRDFNFGTWDLTLGFYFSHTALVGAATPLYCGGATDYGIFRSVEKLKGTSTGYKGGLAKWGLSGASDFSEGQAGMGAGPGAAAGVYHEQTAVRGISIGLSGVHFVK